MQIHTVVKDEPGITTNVEIHMTEIQMTQLQLLIARFAAEL